MSSPKDDDQIEALSRRFGVIVHDRGGADNAEEVLAAVVETLRAEGVRVGGLYQHTTRYPSGRARMDLVDIARQCRYEISQDLGAGSSACCLNPGALVEASAVLRRDIAERVALLVVNKFAGMEVDGEGMAPDAFEALSAGIPVLTCLSVRYQEKFEAVSGGLGTFLPPEETAVVDWARGVLA